MSTNRSTTPRRAVSRALLVLTFTLAASVMATTGAAAAPTTGSSAARGVGEVTTSGS